MSRESLASPLAIRSSAWTACVIIGLLGLGTGCTRQTSATPTSRILEVDAGALDCSTAREGCPCEGDETPSCLIGPSIRDGEVFCTNGVRSCVSGHYTACSETTGERHMGNAEELGLATGSLISGPVQYSSCEPRRYVSNDRPDPADLVAPRATGLIFGNGGAINTGAVTMCNTAACQRTLPAGPGSSNPFVLTPENSDGVVLVDSGPLAGFLTLGVININAPGVWVANMNDGTVSRFDPSTGREIGRYPSTRPSFVNNARPWNEYCNWANTGNCPSRTAVDQNFDAYVANRAFGNQGTVTKYAGRRTACVDRNGNGTIETSTDVNNNGYIDMGVAAEFPGVNDECILWTVPVGVNNGVPRALSVGVAPLGSEVGDVWIGNYNEHRAYRLRPSDGAALGNVSINPIYPYGAVTDPSGRVWFASRASGTTALGRVDPTTMTYASASAAPRGVVAYGIGVFTNSSLTEQFVYVADSDNGRVYRYNILTNTWMDVVVPGTPRGIGADRNGGIWVARWQVSANWAGDCARSFWRFDRDLSNRTQYTPPTASCFMGIGVAFDEAVWAVAGGGNRAVRLSPDRTSWIEAPPVLVGPYTYSDFIGYGLNVFANPRGHYNFTSDSAVAGMPPCSSFRWREVRWQSVVFPNTAAALYVRTAATQAALATQTWVGPFPAGPWVAGLPTNNVSNLQAAPGPVAPGRFIEIDVRMETTDRSITPLVGAVTPVGECDEYLYNDGGAYVRVYNSADRCDDNEDSTYWGAFNWQADIPVGTRIEFQVRGADTEAALAASPVLTITATTNTGTANIETLFSMNGRPIHPKVVSVTAVLRVSADRRLTPTFYSMGLDYNCVAGM